MKIAFGKQVDLREIDKSNIDLFLFAGNHEKRAYTSLDAVEAVSNVKSKVILCYNNKYQVRQGFEGKISVISECSQIYSLLDEVFSRFSGESPTIVIDYSCMTKAWYYSVILYLSKKDLEFKNITAYFIYTPSNYSNPQDPKPNTEIEPLPGKYVVPTDKPKALIVCLGYEQNKAEGIIDHLDPKISYIFYTKPALDDKFVKKLETNNKNILDDKSKIIVQYPFDDLLFLERQLTSIYLSLRHDYSVIMAPLGPKPFAFIAMMMSVKYNDIDIWRVGSGSDINEYERKPLKKENLIISKIFYENGTEGCD